MKFVISAHRTRVIRERKSEFEKIRKNRERFANIIVIGIQKGSGNRNHIMIKEKHKSRVETL